MTKTRNQGKHQHESGRRSGSDSEATNSSDQGQGVVQPVRKLIDKYSTPRKGTARPPTTPASTARRMGPPSSAARSVTRPGTSSALRMINDMTRAAQANAKETDPVEVYCRIKPLGGDSGSCIQILDNTTLALIPPETSVAYKLGTAKENHYTFKYVYGSNASQQQIFDEISLPLVKDFLQGKNGLLFAYGVTGSGKTFTMSGNASDSGIMPRCLDVVFNSISKNQASKYVFKPDRMNGFEAQSKADAMLDRQKEMHDRQRETAKTPRRNGRAHANEYGMDEYSNRVRDETTVPIKNEQALYSVFVTYVEIYNNSVYDLLDESPIDMKARGALQHKMLREDQNRNTYVNGVTEVEVESPEDAFGVYLRGQRRRRMAHTALNTESSRSHSIFNIRLVYAPLDSEGEEVVDDNKLISISQLSLVDLAGSERHGRTQASGDRLKEAGSINNSLMTLRQCMENLRLNQKSNMKLVIPYRDSKLTQFLKNYFDGEGHVRMILCVNPKNEDYDENLHVMAFAELTQEVQIVRPQEKREPYTPKRLNGGDLRLKRPVMEENIIDEHLPSGDFHMIFGLGIPIPICRMIKSTDVDILTTLRKALELRSRGRTELVNHNAEKRQSFRLRLVGQERELQSLRTQNESYRSHIQRLNSEKEKQDNVVLAIVREKGELEKRNEAQEKQIQALEEELMKTKMEVRQRDLAHHKEKENLREDMDLQRELDALKQERTLQQEKAKLQAKFRTKEKTIEAVKQLVSNIDAPAGRTRGSRSRHSRSIVALDLSTTSTESDLPVVSTKSELKPSRSRFMSTPVLHESISVQVNPPSTSRRNALVTSNLPRYGRARSTDRDLWVEHTDRAVVYKPQTVFQPVMKKKKSVNKLSSADDIKGASKYCLLTQEADSDGDIQTKIYKGEINATITGGANMVLKDVEALKQLSPTGNGSPSGRKRSSNSPGPHHRTRRSRIGMGDEPDTLTYSEVEERCRHGLSNIDSKAK